MGVGVPLPRYNTGRFRFTAGKPGFTPGFSEGGLRLSILPISYRPRHLVSPLASPGSTATSPTLAPIKAEVDEYLATTSTSAFVEAAPMWDKPLDWWARNEHRFPHLALMARQYLGCPASAASAERVFSLAGRLFSDLRQSMNDGTLEKRMWAKINRDSNHC